MSKYKIWDKKSDIFTPGREATTGKNQFTAEEWLERYAWAKNPDAKMIISAGAINGAVAMEFNATKEIYAKRGAKITDDMTDEEVLAAIEDFEDNPPEADVPTAEERIAASLEAQVMMASPDAEPTAAAARVMTMAVADADTPVELSRAAKRVQRCRRA